MATRLFRSIVVFGTSLGSGVTIVAGAQVITSGCSLDGGGGDDSWHGIIDAALVDAGCVDAACPDAWYVPIFDAGWPIIDAAMPEPDAAPANAGPPAAAGADPEASPTPGTEPTPSGAP